MPTRTIPALLTVAVFCALTVAALAYSVRKPEAAAEIRDERPRPVVKMTERFGPELALDPGEEVVEDR